MIKIQKSRPHRVSSLAAAVARPDWPPPERRRTMSRCRVISFMYFACDTICVAAPELLAR